MKRILIASSLVAALAVPAMAQQSSQLVQTLEHQMVSLGLSDVDLSTASVNDLARIKWVLDDTDTTIDQKERIQAILN